MDNRQKHRIRELMDYLLHQRNLIDSTGSRIDPDSRKTYQWINQKIQDLQLEVFMDQYQAFESRLEQIFNSTPSFPIKESQHDIP